MYGYMAGSIHFPVREVILSDRFDLAVFRIPHGIGKPVKVGPRVQAGDHIFSTGTTFGNTFLEGIVVAEKFKFYHVDIELPAAERGEFEGRSATYGFLYEGDLIEGFSGGPVVNENGQIVGVNQGKMIEILRGNSDLSLKAEKKHGLAYHIEDVMIEAKRLRKQLKGSE